VISTRGFEDRLQTIENVRKTNVTVCSGGILAWVKVSKIELNAVALSIEPTT
jgi:hypothetical protein